MSKQPADLPRVAWERAFKATLEAVRNKDLAMLAAGVSYFNTLAFFPALAAFIAIYALFVSPAQVLALGDSLKHYIPPAMAEVVVNQISLIAHSSHKGWIAGAVAITLAIFSASSAVQNLIKALNRTFDVEERRKGIKLRLISMGFMVGLVAVGFVVVGLLFMQSSALVGIGVAPVVASVLAALRWPLLIVIVTLVLATVYRYAPDRREPEWKIVSWGGAGATIIWLLGTAAFFAYATLFGSFNKTYGVFAGLIIMMSWFNLSALIVLVGAEVNHHLEEQAEPDPPSRWERLRRIFKLG